MKQLKYVGRLLAMGAMMVSCSLDFNPTGAYSDATFWLSEKNAESGLVGCYLPLSHGSMYGGLAMAMEECASPNAYNYDNRANWNDIAQGTQTAEGGIFSGRWQDAYIGIGRCNTLLANIDQNTELNQDRIDQMKAQARFLRALYYSILVNYYDDVPFITDAPDIVQENLPRTDRKEIVTFMVEELDSVSKILPSSYSAQEDQGRATSGAALALKAKILFFEASPLFNTENSQEAWRKAADAAEAVMQLGYGLHDDYEELFSEDGEHSSECIFDVEFVDEPKGLGHSTDIVMRQWNNAAPLKNFVDAYWMEDGKPREESQYADAENYEHMDPRFYKTIVYPGATWMGEVVKTDNTNVLFTNRQTGFIYKKYTVYTEKTPTEDERNLGEDCSPINIMLLRYADILLMYAEAKNELGEMDETVWNTTIRAIRQRAGFTAASALDFPGGSKEDIMTHIRYERRIEFAGEGTYYNDLRRWKRAEEEMANLNIYRYDGVQIGTRNFNKDRDYWWPVPASQIEADPALRPNNPGW